MKRARRATPLVWWKYGGMSALAVATVMFVATGTAAAVPTSAAVPTADPMAAIRPTTAPPPQLPPNASAKSWQSWAASQRYWIEHIPYRQELQEAGFSVKSITFEPVSSYLDGSVPNGVVTEAAVITGAVPSKGSGLPATAYSDPNVCAAISGPGSACIGGSPYDGGTLLSAAYTYEGGGFADGHVELATGCVGNALANGPDEVLGPGEFQAVAIGPVHVANTWSSTWWNLNGAGGYSDWGSACASF